MKFLTQIWLCLAICVLPVGVWAADLKIQITNARSDEGTMRVYLYSKQDQLFFLKKGFKNFACKEYVPIQQKLAEVTCHDIPPGIYALTFFHDENDNFKFDQNFFNIPKEGYGFSLNYKPTLSAPKFKKVQFQVKKQDQIMILKTLY